VPSLPSAFSYREEIISTAGLSKNADVSCSFVVVVVVVVVVIVVVVVVIWVSFSS
jgi:hypothetical protein